LTRCPSDLELEAMLVGAAPIAGHVRLCAACAARLSEMRRLGEEFERDVFPRTVEAVIAGAARRRLWRPFVWAAPLAAMAAALVLFFSRGVVPPGSYLGVKGPTLSLEAYVQTASGARPVAEGEVVEAGAGLRFEIRAARACHLWIVSADSSGQVSVIYPPADPNGAQVAAGKPMALPGGAVLDGRSGPERFFAVCAPPGVPTDLASVDRAARSVGPGEDRVRATRKLPEIPPEALQATLLVEKRP